MKNILFVFILICFISCCDDNNTSINIKSINVYENKLTNAKLSDIIESVRYVPLEYTEGAIMGPILKIKLSDDYIFVNSVESELLANPNVFKFDNKGKFISKVFSKGNAGNEIIRMNDFDINEITKEVLVLDNATKRLQRYSFDGNYLGCYSLPFYSPNFAVVGENYVFRLTPVNPFFIPAENYLIATVNKDFELIDKIGKYNSEGVNSLIGRSPYFTGDIFSFPYDNICLNINNKGKIDSLYHFDLGDKTMNEKEIEAAKNALPGLPRETEKVNLYDCPLNSPNYLILRVNDCNPQDKGFLIFDKKNNISCFIGKDYDLDRDDMLILKAPIAYCESTDEFVYSVPKVSMEELKNNLVTKLYDQLSADSKKILIGDPDTSNNILVFVKFKDIKELIKKYKTK